MLNCPGRNGAVRRRRPRASSVKVSCVSRTTRRMRAGRGTIGLAGAAIHPAASRSVAVDVEELEPRRLQALLHDVREALQELVAEVVVGLALAAQALAVERDGARRLDRARVEHPVVGRDEPRPAEDVARAERLHDERRAPRRGDLERHPALAEEEELVRLLARPEEEVRRRRSARCSRSRRAGSGGVGSRPWKNGCAGQDALKRLHARSLPASGSRGRRSRGWRAPPR